MGASIILNSRYFRVAKPGEQEVKNHVLIKSHVADLVEYVGTRESVSFNTSDVTMQGEATDKQKLALQNLMNECEDYKNTHEYKDYIANPSKANASELISRLSEMLLLDNGIYAGDAASKLVSYVGTRPSVDIEKSQQHGLFSSSENVNLSKAMEEISNHQGRVWTHVISLRREDADRLGYSSQAPWKQLVRSKIDTIAKANNIKFENLRWYAGMHNTGHHPHIHLFIYSTDPKEGFINKNGIKNIKSSFANEIFKDDLKFIFVEQTEYRNKIKNEMSQLVDKINENPLSQFDNDTLKHLQQGLQTLAKHLPQTGKYYYKYQSKEVKNMVDDLLKSIMEKSPDMHKLYGMWCSEQEKILGTYNNEPNYKTPIERNNNFKFLKNSLLKKARELQPYIYNKDITVSKLSNINHFDVDIEENIITYENQETKNNNIENDKISVKIEKTENINDVSENISDNNSIPKNISENAPDELSNIGNDYTIEKTLAMPVFLITNEDFLKLIYQAESNPNAAYEVAVSYLYGNNVTKNYELAQQYMVMAANGSNAFAHYELGKMYSNGVGVEADKEISIKYFQQAHDLLLSMLTPNIIDCIYAKVRIPKINYDTCKVLYTLGVMYYKGLGVEQDYQKAGMYFSQSAEKIPYSNIYLGNMKMYGLGTEVNYITAKNYYEGAAQSNSELTQAQASYKIGMMYEKGLGTNIDYRAAFSNYLKAAKLNFADAHYKMGELLANEKFQIKDIGKEQADICYTNAFDLYTKADIEMPNSSTELTIGTMYAKGQGVPQDEDKAVKWFTKSADKGNAIAYQKLGLIFADEASKYYDTEQAIEYLEKSIKEGNDFANYQLGKIYVDPESKFYDIAKAVAHLQISANEGNHFANYQLGKVYSSYGTKFFDVHKAIKNFKISALKGNIEAFYQMGKVYANPNYDCYSPIKAFDCFRIAQNNGHPYAQNQINRLNDRVNNSQTTNSSNLEQTLNSLSSILRLMAQAMRNDMNYRINNQNKIDSKARMKIKNQKIKHGHNKNENEFNIY